MTPQGTENRAGSSAKQQNGIEHSASSGGAMPQTRWRHAAKAQEAVFAGVPNSAGPFHKAVNLAEIFEGNVYGRTETYFYDASTGKYSRWKPGIYLTDFVLGEFIRLLGEDNVVLQ